MRELGRVLIGLGCLAVVLGAALLLADRIPWLGRLPGDIVVRRGPVTFYFPLLTCVVLSVVLTIVVNLFWRPRRPRKCFARFFASLVAAPRPCLRAPQSLPSAGSNARPVRSVAPLGACARGAPPPA